VIAIVLLGAGFGGGVWALAIWAFPPRQPLGSMLEHLQQPPSPHTVPTSATGQEAGWAARLGRPAAPVLRRLGMPDLRRSRDLVIVGRDADSYLAEKATLTLVGLLTPPVAVTVLAILGTPPSLPVPAALTLGCAALGFLLPDLRLRADAARRREDFRHALSAYLDLVVISLSGGAGIDGALTDSVTVGNGWAFTQIRHTLQAAQLTRTTPWVALGRLGTEIDSRELSELAASLSLAGTEGARIRTSLTARAQSLRTHLLTDADASARAATERMGLAWGLLFLGFLIFIGYPAVEQILNGL
jgi:tight adherence protein C